MLKRFTQIMLRNMGTLEVDINNCPDELWDKVYGGDLLWRQAFHAISGTMGMLCGEGDEAPELPIPVEEAYLVNKTAYTGPHGRDMMLKLLQTAKEFIPKIMATKDESKIFEMVDFYGMEMTYFERLAIIEGHILYHVGIFDAALRDNGLKGVI